MTSSYRATGAASVRQAAEVIENAAAWTLSELAFPPTAGALIEEEVQVEEIDPAAAAAERAALIDEHYARGLVDGERKATAAAQARIAELLAVVTEATNKLGEATSIAPSVLEENIATLAVIVARQIVQREVTFDHEIIADLVRRSLTEFPIDHPVRIRVNPMDLALLTTTGDRTPITGKYEVSWLADPRISRGGCLIEARDRIIDGRVDTALERAYRKMSQHDA